MARLLFTQGGIAIRILRPPCVGMLWLAIALAGCTHAPTGPVAPQKKVQLVWPAPPDQPRFRYAGKLRSAADLEVPEEASAIARLKSLATPENNARNEPVIYKPSGIAVRNGLVYVAEPAAQAVTVFDIPRRKIFRFGQRPPNKLVKPAAIAVNDAGEVFVLDSKLKQVMVFDSYGLFLRSVPLGARFSRPVAIASNHDGSTVFVVDRGTVEDNEHKVVALDAQGNERFSLGPRGSREGEFNMPLAATVGRDGTLYVVDAGNFRVQAFDSTGKFKLAFGSLGAGIGQFSRPVSIATDAEDNIYVADNTFNNVQIFNAQGELLMPLGQLGQQPRPGNFSLISSVATDNQGHLLVLDNYFKKIEVYNRIAESEPIRAAVND